MQGNYYQLERCFWPLRIARCPVYRIKTARLFYINPLLLGKKLFIPWWPRFNPPSKKDEERILDSLALSVLPSHDNGKIAGEYIAFDTGRSILLPPRKFKGPSGRIYRDISLKGVGPIAKFVGQENILNHFLANGLFSLNGAYKDFARSIVLSKAGVYVPLPLLIIDTGLEHIDYYNTQLSYYVCRCKTVILVRGMTVNTRLYNLRGIDSARLREYLSYELNYLSRVEGEPLSDYGRYLCWFARRMACQAAKLQRLGYLHDVPHAQQICLDGSVCDHEYECGSGFLKDPRPDDHHLYDIYTFGKQPNIFSSFVAHDDFEDSLWQILKRLSKKNLPGKDSVLEEFWNEYNLVFKKWEPPPIDNIIKDFGLNDDNLLHKIFGTVIISEKMPLPKVVLSIKRR